MISQNMLRKYPITKNVLEYINKNFILFDRSYNYIKESFDEEYLSFSEELLTILKRKYETEQGFSNCIKAFIRLSIDVLILQKKLNRDGKYSCSSFEDANKNVYQAGKMNNYLDGLLLSQIFWPNHYRFREYFITLSTLTTPSSEILDAPSGPGIYSYYIAKFFPYKNFYSIDISPFSKSCTESLLKHSQVDTDRITLKLTNIYDLNNEQKFDLIACGELLEHIQDPDELLNKLYILLKDKGTLFLTTAIYAAAEDHIYLFNNVNEVREILEKRFHIASELILPTSLEPYSPDMNKVPINYACKLVKMEK